MAMAPAAHDWLKANRQYVRLLLVACIHALARLLAEVLVGPTPASLAASRLSSLVLAPLLALLRASLFQLDRVDQCVDPWLRARACKRCSLQFGPWRERNRDRHGQDCNEGLPDVHFRLPPFIGPGVLCDGAVARQQAKLRGPSRARHAKPTLKAATRTDNDCDAVRPHQWPKGHEVAQTPLRRCPRARAIFSQLRMLEIAARSCLASRGSAKSGYNP